MKSVITNKIESKITTKLFFLGSTGETGGAAGCSEAGKVGFSESML